MDLSNNTLRSGPERISRFDWVHGQMTLTEVSIPDCRLSMRSDIQFQNVGTDLGTGTWQRENFSERACDPL